MADLGGRDATDLRTGSKKLGMSEYAERFAENDIVAPQSGRPRWPPAIRRG